MTLPQARALAASLAPKQPGHLITAADWNSLISVLVEYGDALIGLPARMDAAEAAIAALDVRVDALELLPARVQTLEDETAPLRENYRLQVRTTAENFLVGQVAELVFTARALDGGPLAAPMPWLDVVTTWGRLRAAPGFTARDNAEENALSVQFNAAGEVRVQLRSHFTRGFSASTEASFSTALKAQAGSTGKTVQQIIQGAASPQDAEVKVAFKTLHATYDATPTVRTYTDRYVVQAGGGKVVGRKVGFPVQVAGEWEEYRATVMAFAKPDASPTTPDPTRGIATVQVTFREWIPYWSDDYVETLEPVLLDWTAVLTQNLSRNDVLPFVVTELEKRAKGDGVLGHQRNLAALEKAATTINPGNDPFAAQSKALVQGAMQMQLATGSPDTQTASGYAKQAQVSQQTSQTARAAQVTAQDAASAKQAVQVLEGRMKAAEQTGKEISAGLRNIGDGVNKINVAEVADLGGRLNKINLSLNELSKKIPGG